MASSESEETSSDRPVKQAFPAEKDKESDAESEEPPPMTTKRKRKGEAEVAKKKKKKPEKDAEGELAQANGVEEKKKNKQKKKASDEKAERSEEKAAEEVSEKKKKKKNCEKQQEQQEADDPKEKKQQDKPAAAAVAAAAAAGEAQKPKPAQKNSWVAKDEHMLAKQMLEDVKANPGLNFDEKPKGDNYWSQLHEALKEKLSREWSADQIFEKHKRMKMKLKKFEQEQADVTRSAKKRKHATDELHGIFKQLWSSEDGGAATAGGGSKPSAFGSKLAAQSDGEESNGEFGGFPASVKREVLEAKGLANGKSILGPVVETTPAGGGAGTSGGGAANELSRVMKSFLLETISQVSSVAGADPVISFGSSLCAGVESLMKSYKLGFEASTANRDVKKKVLEEQAGEYSAMKRRLKLVLDYCELEEEVLKKKLEAM